MATKKIFTPKAAPTQPAQPAQPKPASKFTWKDVEVNHYNRTYQPRKGSSVTLPSELSKKQAFYRMVGRNLMVLERQNIVSDTGRVTRISRDSSLLGDRAKSIKPETRVHELLKILYGANKWRKAEPTEVVDYKAFIIERDAFVEKEHAKNRKAMLDSLRNDLKQAQRRTEYYQKRVTQLEQAETKTVNK